TSHVSHRRLPGQEARRVVGTPPLSSPTNAETPDDNKTQSKASEDDELWSNMSESGLPTGMNSLTLYEGDSPALITPKSPGHSTTMASEKVPLSTATPKDRGRLQGYLLTPPHSDSATGPREVVREIEHLVDFGIKQSQHFTWYSPRQTTDESAWAVETAKALSSLRPRQWLNDDAIMETLYRLADDRSDVQVVDSHTFQSYYERWASKKELPSKAFQWDSPSLVLIPVFEAAHWFLVSMKFGEGIITFHDDLQHAEIENFMLDIFADSWSIDRHGVSTRYPSPRPD
nr:hypothetical protein [Nostoc sp. EkiNYC01]